MLVFSIFVENGLKLKKIEGITVRKEKKRGKFMKNRLIYFFIDSKKGE